MAKKVKFNRKKIVFISKFAYTYYISKKAKYLSVIPNL